MTLQELIGSGKYGEMHKVTYNGKLFACKKIHEGIVPSYPTKSQSEWINETTKEIMKLIQTIKHPNIEKYEMVLEQAPTFLLLSELLPDNLDNFIFQLNDKMHVYLQVNICHDMALGLQYLHSAGIAHKNLHCGNVLITHEIHAKIADYICPQVLAMDNATSTASDEAYLASKVKSNELHDFSSDVFSLGTLFFQTVTTYLPTEIYILPERIRSVKDIDKVPSDHPLHMVIRQSLVTNELARPSVNEVSNAMAKAKENPQYILSLNLHGKKVSIAISYTQIHPHT